MGASVKIINGFQPLTNFAKNAILDVLIGFKYTSVKKLSFMNGLVDVYPPENSIRIQRQSIWMKRKKSKIQKRQNKQNISSSGFQRHI